MTVKSCEKLEKSRVALTIETSAEEFEAAVNKAYLKMRGKINVPGFRVGKAPRKIIEKMYGAEVFYEEAVNIILPDAYEAAVKEQELNVVGYPEVELESCTKDGVVFKCTVAIYPEVKLGQYKGLEAPKAEVKVAAADVNARLKEMADRNSRLVSVDRAVKKGDTADIDFEGFDNGKAFDGGKGENFDLEIGSGSFVPGFEDQLIDMKAGEEKDIDITFPENYTPELAGKPVVFHVKVNEVKVKEIPAMDDEFAKDVSEFDANFSVNFGLFLLRFFTVCQFFLLSSLSRTQSKGICAAPSRPHCRCLFVSFNISAAEGSPVPPGLRTALRGCRSPRRSGVPFPAGCPRRRPAGTPPAPGCRRPAGPSASASSLHGGR